MFSCKKILIPALMAITLTSSGIHAHKPLPKLPYSVTHGIHNPPIGFPVFAMPVGFPVLAMPAPTRWDRLVQWARSKKNYILPVSAAAGVTAGLIYLAIPNNQSVLEKITSAGKLSLNSAVGSATLLGVNYFGLVELAD